MRRRAALFVLAGVCACSARAGRAGAPPDAAPAGAPAALLEIGAEDEAAPWSQKDGTGYANDVVRAAYRAAGTEVRLEVLPYARCKQMLLAGELAACFSMSPLAELDDSVVFSDEPLFVVQSELVQRADDARPCADASQLRRRTLVGTVLGYEYPAELARLEQAGAIVLENTMSEELNLKKLVDGRLDAAVVNGDAIKTFDYMTARAGVTGKVKRCFRIGEERAYIGFSRKHPRGAEARARFEEGMRKIVDEGVPARLAEEWAARVAGTR